MKKNFMLIGLLTFVLFFVAPMTAEASESAGEGNWRQSANGWWFETTDGDYLADGFYDIDGVTYYFDAAGWMKTGWVYVEEEVDVEGTVETVGFWFYFNNSGAMVKGWVQDGADWYYMDPEYGYMWTDSLVDDTYYVGYDGTMLTDDYIYGYLYDGPTGFDANGHIIKNGWLLIAEYDMYGWAYFDANGQYIEEGWVQSGSDWYYMANGIARVGTYLMDYNGQTHLYKFATDGRLVVDKVATTGWIEADGFWYYYEIGADYQGLVKQDWREIGGAWYYFGYEGKMAANELVYDGVDGQYVIGSDGRMAVNQWAQYYEEWVYADASGRAIQNDWLQIGNTWYYFDGYWMVDAPTYIDGQLNLFNNSGVWLGVSNVSNGWVAAGDGRWFYLENGQLTYGWKQIGGVWYYFDNWTGRTYVDGVYWCEDENGTGDTYIFDANGAMVYGWYQDSWGDWCYADATRGVLRDEWLQVGNTWYYFEGGWMVDGRTTWIDDEYHAFADGGAWIGTVSCDEDGWKYIGGKWYYVEYGDLVWGIKKIDGQIYGFVNEMLTNDHYNIYVYDYGYQGTRLGVYEYLIGFDANGHMMKNQWLYLEWFDEWVWFDSNGYAVPPANYYGGIGGMMM